MRKLPLLEASATLIGTAIGAGILGIPYAVSQVGFPLGIAIMTIMALVVGLRHLMLAEITLRTPHVHQMPGYAGIYLGPWLKRVSFTAVLLGGYGSLLAYTIGQGEVLAVLFGGSMVWWSLGFFAFGVTLVYFGLNVIKRSELVMTVFIFLITVAIGIFAWNDITFDNLVFFEPGKWVLPYGVLLFAFSGSIAIPQMREELKGRERDLKKSLFIGSFAVFGVYLLFTYLVLGVTGNDTTDIATIGLGDKIGPQMILIGNLLAFFTMGTSFLTSALGMKEVFMFDYHFSGSKSWWMTVVVPLLLFISGVRDFIAVLGIAGGVLSGIQSIVIVLSFWRARKTGWRKPEFTIGPMRLWGSVLIIFFLLGAVMTIINI